MPYPTEAEIAQIKAKNPGELHVLCYGEGGQHAVIAKTPSKGEWDRFTTTSTADRANAARALKDMTRACIVWPDAAALDAIEEARPALLTQFGGELCDLAGNSEKIRVKKL